MGGTSGQASEELLSDGAARVKACEHVRRDYASPGQSQFTILASQGLMKTQILQYKCVKLAVGNVLASAVICSWQGAREGNSTLHFPGPPVR